MGDVAAVFDLDNTLVRGASLFHLVRDLFHDGALSRGMLARAAAQQALYRVTAREHGVESAREAGLSLIAGVDARDVERACRASLSKALPDALYDGSVRMLRAHQQAGHKVFIASATPVEVARVVADLLGCDGAVGTVAERHDGVFTGRLAGHVLRGPAKAAAVEQLLRSAGVDPGRSSAYSDSHHDIPMLDLVGHPHAVNPDGRLRHHARVHEWPVHDVSRRYLAVRAALGGASAVGAAAGVACVHAALRQR